MPTGTAISTIRQRIIDTATPWVGQIGGSVGGKIKGAEHIVQMYKEAVIGPTSFVTGLQKPTVAALILEGTEKGLWLLKKGWRTVPQDSPPYLQMMVDLNEKSLGVMWCGIFATWMLQKSGLNVGWINGLGIQAPSGDVKLEFTTNNTSTVTQAQRDNMDVGDVCVTGDNQHHVIIVDARPGVDNVTVVEGNIPLPRHSVLGTIYNKRDFHTHYKIVERASFSSHKCNMV